MHRRPSPLLHDYKPSGSKKPKKSKALQWFAVGLGIPLAGLALISTLDTTPPVVAQDTMPATMTSTDVSPIQVPESNVEDALPAELVVVTEPEPMPTFASLSLKIGRGDTLDKLFRQHNLNLGHLAAIAKLDEPRRLFRRLKPGDEFEVQHDNGSVVSMYSALDLTSALKVDRVESGYVAEIVERPIDVHKRIAHGVINSSLFESGADAGLSDKVIMNVAGIFAWDVDFVLDIRKGDNFYVQYEEIWQDGEYVSDGEIIAAEFNNNGRTHRAIRHIGEDGVADYYTPDGDSVRKAFLRSPVDFRVSSSFNPNRLHPVLKTRRPHRGVDYAAPRGSPIKATGDGKIIFRGTQNGYGKVVILQHGGNITTLYAHMSSFDRNARSGSRVRQGQTIGYVGATGMVTGVHLHYEYRLNGVHRNPRTVSLPHAAPIDERYRERFLASVGPILAEIESFKRTQVASVAANDDPS